MDTDLVIKTENNALIAEDAVKNEFFNMILSERVSVSIGNFIFIPSIENPVVSGPHRIAQIFETYADKAVDTYVPTKINIDGNDYVMFTHISRLVNESPSKSLSVYSVENFNKEEFCKVFKNEFPPILLKTLQTYLENATHLRYHDELKNIEHEEHI
jgi:hypothetical protein